MPYKTARTPAHWSAEELTRDQSWIYRIDADQAAHLRRGVQEAYDPARQIFDYGKDDFDLGSARDVFAAAFAEQAQGRGVSLVKGLPREGMSEAEFELMTWGIGLHFGVARPQGKASQYISAVRDAGQTYRHGGGRGYNTKASLDFHIDGSDVVALTCYNAAKSGGMSMCSSSMTLHDRMAAERPDLLELLYQPYAYSRQGEQAPDEAPYLLCPLFGMRDGRLFGRLNRNRVNMAQRLDGVAPLSEQQWEALDLVEEIIRRPDVMFSMWLEPGDMQLINNHVVLHSRTEFEDHEEPERKRLLFRLWLSTPDSVALPPEWAECYKSVEPASVRGGIRGFGWNEACRAFERRQAAALGMHVAH
ncbi:TauD/TfdA family dioxygenase [Neoroseomonas oryzicola]|uniref:TauD/TfdA family dioxygenase n=1 Tax=Neoroseomonas oryzicola TaxID=535904 RepID=A0A9X9WKT3_9PROT|nr:TauD/TfdA family dioxygenase [Neoroseomonas oryzicola]MBR0660943.1 TauD/TfdA family dioxygenase [Neoroseomonas oryzicola]NKE19823.1 TauD/TfdA family dioxygenase [Neoroseomonas oryzicola]